MNLSEISTNYERVLENIERAANQAGRNADSVNLIVVTKGHPVDRIERVIDAGAQLLGENYVEEALPKIDSVPNFNGEWHMIGHIQSRKASAVCQHFGFVHSLDSLKLARRLNRFAEQENRILPVLMECNVSGESSKYGWSAWKEEDIPQLFEAVAEVMELKCLQVKGLMTMPPFSDDAEQSRPYFQKLRKLQFMFQEHFPEESWVELSMGMSIDYEIAIQEGATMLRIGTEIMGPRPK